MLREKRKERRRLMDDIQETNIFSGKPEKKRLLVRVILKWSLKD
jgi:hypothetical protein